MLEFKNKKIVIFGLGNYKDGSGISAAKFFIQHGAKVLITDIKKENLLKDAVGTIKKFARRYGAKPIFVLGKHREKDFKTADIVVRNPGVPNDNKFLAIARSAGVPIHTDVSLFLRLIEENTKVHVIGITGTRGKSTTSALVASLLKLANKKVFVGGNLGYSPLNFLDKIITSEANFHVRHDADIYIVLELSSWMVESLDEHAIRMPYAVITNIYPDHLNTYVSMDDYIAAKAGIFKHQRAHDILIINKDNSVTQILGKRAHSRVIWFSKNDPKIANICARASVSLRGEHNSENIAAAHAVAVALGISPRLIGEAVRKFKGLSGRLEFIRTVRGVNFYNDTTATMPEATCEALRTLSRGANNLTKKSPKRIILIAGGADKKLDYKMLAREIPKYVKLLILFQGEASKKLLKELHAAHRTLEIRYFLDTMKEAVRAAVCAAKRGDLIVLSPAAASFNMFKNEFDRGEQFIRAIKI